MIIREATAADVPAITAIYNHAVVNTTAIWNETTVDAANRAAWLEGRRQAGFPVIVAVEEGVDADEVLAYATFGEWRAWDGYRHTVEHSVYVREGQQGRGLGTALMRELIERARGLGVHAIIAGIEAGNAGSIALHERLGFEHAGYLRQVGTKFGRWLDLVFLQLILEGPVDAGENSRP